MVEFLSCPETDNDLIITSHLKLNCFQNSLSLIFPFAFMQVVTTVLFHTVHLQERQFFQLGSFIHIHYLLRLNVITCFGGCILKHRPICLIKLDAQAETMENNLISLEQIKALDVLFLPANNTLTMVSGFCFDRDYNGRHNQKLLCLWEIYTDQK